MRLNFTTLGIAAAMLVGCNQASIESAPEPTSEAERRALMKELSTYQDPREGYKPNPNICAVPPCGGAVEKSEDKAGTTDQSDEHQSNLGS